MLTCPFLQMGLLIGPYSADPMHYGYRPSLTPYLYLPIIVGSLRSLGGRYGLRNQLMQSEAHAATFPNEGKFPLILTRQFPCVADRSARRPYCSL